MINTIVQLLYYALFIFAPLIMSKDTSELFEFNKMILIYLITSLILFFWILKMILAKKIILKKTYLDIPILLFLASQILSTIFSIDPHTSFFGYYGRFNGGLLSIITYIVLYYGFVSNFFESGNRIIVIRKLLILSLASSVIVILWGLPGRFGYDLSCLLFTGQFNNSCWTDQFHPEQRMFSTLGQPNWLGSYLAINYFVALYMLLRKYFLNKSVKKAHDQKGYIRQTNPIVRISISKVILYGYLLLNFSAILFTRSRSVLISVMSGLVGLTMVFVILPQLRRRLKNALLISLIVVSLILLPILVFKTGTEKIDKYLSFSLIKTSIPNKSNDPVVANRTNAVNTVRISESFDIRKIVWQGAIELGKRYPVFGTGPETFAYSYYFVRPVSHNLTSEWDYLYNKAHNEYLNYFATTGFTGIGAYLLVIVTVLIVFIRNILSNSKPSESEDKHDTPDDFRLLNICLFIAYLSVLVTNVFGFSTSTINLFFFMIPAFIISPNKPGNKASDSVGSKSFSLMQGIMVTVLGVMTIFALFYFITYFVADTSYATGDNYYKAGDYQNAAVYLTRALRLKNEHVYQDKLSYTLANLAVIASYQKQPEISRQLIDMSNTYNDQSIKSTPKNVLYWKTNAKNHYLYYQINLKKTTLDDGISSLKQAEKLSPTDPKIPYSAAIFYSILSDDEQNKSLGESYKQLALREADKSIDLKTNFKDAYLLKSQLLKKYGNKAEAKKTLEYILTNIDPNDSEAVKEINSL